jgi:GAF domain-containing protein
VWWTSGAPDGDLPGVLARVGFILLFAVLYHAVLWARLAAARRNEREAVDRRLRDLDERAREMRLLSPRGMDRAASGGEEQALLRGRAAAVQVEAAMAGAMEVAEAALRSHTCALYLLSQDDATLRLRECRSGSDQVARRPLPAAEGVLGSVISRRAPLRLAGDIRSATYYEDGTRPRALVAAPLVDRRGGHVRGVLVADRLEDLPFDDSDEHLVARVAGELIRAVESERILVRLEAERDEKEFFYSAIEQLNRKSKTQDVLDAAIDVAARIVQLDFGAVTIHEPEAPRRPHRVVKAVTSSSHGWQVSELLGLRFSAQSGLVASAVRHGSTLPGQGERVDRMKVFDEGTQLKGLGSVRVFPLRSGDQTLGTLVLGSRRPDAFEGEASRQLEVIAMQVADALLRARLFEQTERLASTDGLTGLHNHRTFQARLDEQFRLAQRHGKRLSVVLCEVGERRPRPPGGRPGAAGRGQRPGRGGARDRSRRPLRRRGVRHHHAGDRRRGGEDHRRAGPGAARGHGLPHRGRAPPRDPLAGDRHLPGRRRGEGPPGRGGRRVPLPRQAIGPEPHRTLVRPVRRPDPLLDSASNPGRRRILPGQVGS